MYIYIYLGGFGGSWETELVGLRTERGEGLGDIGLEYGASSSKQYGCHG